MFMQNGFDDYITKPIDIRALNSLLKKFIRDKQPPEVIEAANKRRKKKSGKTPKINALLAEPLIKDARHALDELEKLYEADDFDNPENIHSYKVLTHGIKGALAIVGETELSTAAATLETAANEQDIDEILEATPRFLDGLRKLIEKYSG
jgi:HPt (histidine-containing phosphotransfer) domain-containing protein